MAAKARRPRIDRGVCTDRPLCSAAMRNAVVPLTKKAKNHTDTLVDEWAAIVLGVCDRLHGRITGFG